MLGYLYGKRFGSKMAWANRKEGDRIGAGPIGSGFFEPNLFLYKYSNILNPDHSSYLPSYKDVTECSKMLAYKIQTPGNYQEESIQHSEHGKSLKSRKNNAVWQMWYPYLSYS
jgi:hypothetical protein